MRDLYILIGIIASIVFGVWLFSYVKEKREENLKRLSYKVYLFEKGKIPEKEILKITKGTSFYPYVLAKLGKYEKAYEELNDEELKSLYLERYSAKLYEKKKYKKTLENLEKVNEKNFNYPSVLTLKAFTYKKLGNENKAISLWALLKEKYSNTYFGNLANIILSIRGVEK